MAQALTASGRFLEFVIHVDARLHAERQRPGIADERARLARLQAALRLCADGEPDAFELAQLAPYAADVRAALATRVRALEGELAAARGALEAIAERYKVFEAFVLRYDSDVHARAAMRAYAASCRVDNPTLASDLLAMASRHAR